MGVLQDILDAQREFEHRVRHDPELPHYQKISRLEHLIWIGHAIMHEGSEFVNWFNWKPHKRNYMQPQTDEEGREAIVELIDILHYTVAGLLEFGITSEKQVKDLYFKKNHENHSRQDAGY